jgi:DNA-binding NarL/FixJ family response regulator
MTDPITVLITDDHGVLCDGLSAVLNMEPDIEVVGLAADGREAMELADALHPDVVILDIFMPGMNGLEAAAHIRQLTPAPQMIMLSMHLTEDHVRGAFRAGASGYLLKESAGQDVVKAVRTVAAGERFLCPQVSSMLLDGYLLTENGREQQPSLSLLSERERQVLQLLVAGSSNSDIASKLDLSPKTVHTYRTRIMDKLDIPDLPGLVRFAIQHGLITL